MRRAQHWRLPRLHGVVGLGDSIMLGDDADPALGFLAANSWLTVAAAHGARYGYNASVAGATSEDIARAAPGVLRWHPTLTVVGGGTNDVLRGRSVDRAVSHLGTAIDRLRAGTCVAVAAAPPIDQPPFALAVRALNDGLRGLAHCRGLPFIEFHAALSGGDGSYIAGLSEDGVHPNVRGAEIMAEVALPYLTASKP